MIFLYLNLLMSCMLLFLKLAVYLKISNFYKNKINFNIFFYIFLNSKIQGCLSFEGLILNYSKNIIIYFFKN